MRRKPVVRWRVRALAAVTMVVLGAPSSGVAQSAGAVQLSADAIADAVRFRTDVGLRADGAYIRAAESNAIQFPNRDFGVPLTVAEAREVHRRVQVQLDKGPASIFARSLPESAGVYTDHAAGGAPVFLFKGNGEAFRGTLTKLLPAGTSYRIETVERSITDLEALRDAVNAATDTLAAQGIEVTLTGIDTPANRLMIGVHGLTTSKADLLQSWFGSGIVVREQANAVADACSFTSCWPPKGGFKITGVNGFSCTSTFIATKENNPNSLALLTAGHCLSVNGGAGKNWTHNSMLIGTSTGNTWVAGADADAGFITINAAALGDIGIKNLYIDTPPDTHGLSVVVETANQDPGDLICRTGITSGKDCGHIALENVTNQSCVTVGGKETCKSIDRTWEVDFDSTGGDSGGPYHVGISTGFGVHVHSDKDGTPGARGWYSPLGWVRTEFFNRFGVFYGYCLSGNCGVHWP